MGKKFNQYLKNMAKAGIYVGDINQATAAFQGGPLPKDPAKAAPSPPPKPAPSKIQSPKTNYSTRDTTTSGVKVKSKGSKRRRRATQRGVSQLRIPLNTGQAKSGGLNV
jgi:hypothetical protein